jgi:hypothetical protein
MAAAKKKRNISVTGATIPDYGIIDPGMKPVTINGIKRDYERLVADACYFIHTEVDRKKLTGEFIKYCAATFDKKEAATLKKLSDYYFHSIGKMTYIISQGGKLDQERLDVIQQYYHNLLEKAKAVVEETKEEVTEKPKGKVTSIQDRMKEQVSELLGTWEGYIDDWMDKQYDLKKFDPYREMMSHQPQIKPAHAKIIQDAFAPMLAEAREVLEFKDEDIKEGYQFFTARAAERKKFLAFYEAIHTACDTIINTGKATRKTRAKKAPSKDKLIAKLKYKESEPSVGLASINPVSIIDASTLWVYNTKNRKLIKYVADPLIKVLGVKGTTIVGFDEANTVQKTVRKPEVLKGAGKLARTKFDKLYNELTTTESKANGRINEHCILIKVF